MFSLPPVPNKSVIYGDVSLQIHLLTHVFECQKSNLPYSNTANSFICFFFLTVLADCMLIRYLKSASIPKKSSNIISLFCFFVRMTDNLRILSFIDRYIREDKRIMNYQNLNLVGIACVSGMSRCF